MDVKQVRSVQEVKPNYSELFSSFGKAESHTTSSLMRDFYMDVVRLKLSKTLGYVNLLRTPKLLKIVLSSSFNSENRKNLPDLIQILSAVSGQIPSIKKAKKSISNFKLKEGDIVGCVVTLRSKRMYAFWERFIFGYLARIDNFRGFSMKGFDGNGNFSFGLTNHRLFFEFSAMKLDADYGLNISIVTSAASNYESALLLGELGLPFSLEKHSN